MREPLLPSKLKDGTEEIGLIQGQVPDSKNEYWFAQALEAMKIPYIYQYQVGTMGVRGSQLIDFLALIPGRTSACFIQGAWWHRAATESEDRLKQAAAEQIFGKGNVFTFNEEETENTGAAIASVKEKLL